jgi:hypothetical protein
LIHTGWWFAALLFSGYLVSVDDVSFVFVMLPMTPAL